MEHRRRNPAGPAGPSALHHGQKGPQTLLQTLLPHLGQAAQGVRDLVRQALGVLHQDDGRGLRQRAGLQKPEVAESRQVQAIAE